MPTISRRLASAGIADPGDLKSPSLPGASPGSPTGVWLIGNSRPVRLKIEQPWECKSPHADQFGMSTGRAGRTCLLNSGLPEKGVWCESTAFRHSCARSSKRAGGLIPRIALDQCRVPERYRTRVPIFVPIAQSTERARPKRQVAGESPAGDTSFAGVVQQQNAAVPRPRRRCDSVHPLHSRGSVAHQQSARVTCERQRGQHSPLPPFLRA
jgi:hypothetical protein